MANQEDKFVAQAIDYLSSLTALTVDELDALVAGKLKAALNNFVYDEENESSFELAWNAIGTNLRAGQARLVVVLDDARPDLERIFHFLARNSKLDVQLFTVQRYSSANGDEVFVPRVLVNPASEDDGTRVSATPQKSFEELLAGCTNPVAVAFFRDRLNQNPRPRTNSHDNALVYPASGTMRWYVNVRKDCARVTQIGRFQNDEEQWKKQLSAPDFGYEKGQKDNLLFSLSTPADFAFFQDMSAASAFVTTRFRGNYLPSSKGDVLERLLASQPEPDFLFAVGDDRTDEDLFERLQKDAYTLHVGTGPTRAAFAVPDSRSVRDLLEILVQAPPVTVSASSTG